MNTAQSESAQKEVLFQAMEEACAKIAPLWSLENFVAVNPYMGLSDRRFDQAAHELALLGGIHATLPLSFYLEKLEEGTISREDIGSALKKHGRKVATDAFIQGLYSADESTSDSPMATLSEVASVPTGIDWCRFMINQVSAWAATYFDKGQATWKQSAPTRGIFAAWRGEASVDRSASVQGLNGFHRKVAALPNEQGAAVQYALNVLGVPQEALPFYFHRLLLHVGGWSAHVARLDWDARLHKQEGGRLEEFLTVLLCWEACILQCLEEDTVLQGLWEEAIHELAVLPGQEYIDTQLAELLVMQEAFDMAAQRELVGKFAQGTKRGEKKPKTTAQAVFCIDVRSEVYRRNLEQIDSSIETIGFAGFFGFPISYVPMGHEEGAAQCPVLLPAGPVIHEEITRSGMHRFAVTSRRLDVQFNKLWRSFKSGAVSCFSFVSPLGLSYLPKLFTDSFGLTRPVEHPDKVGLSKEQLSHRTVNVCGDHGEQPLHGMSIEQQMQMAKNALNAMSLSADFAPLVLIVGHGASTVNNPHATGLDCGACGGHSGEANARVAAAVLNSLKVRDRLSEEGIYIPSTTHFLACLHDTTTDEIEIMQEQAVPLYLAEELLSLKSKLKKASKASRAERALRVIAEPNGNPESLIGRSKDWSQVRPEWGLAGCSTFVVAPRERSKALDLGGKSFLHSYDWKKDKEFGILELIMTAPMVVTSWINLQYYASTVDNDRLGAGNKTLHNITSGLGVLEGYGGDLRVGLPLQSVHDGEKFQHEPLRLKVVIEAPTWAMNEILEKHESIRNLCDNEWIFLFAMDEEGKVAHRYTGDLQWEEVSA